MSDPVKLKFKYEAGEPGRITFKTDDGAEHELLISCILFDVWDNGEDKGAQRFTMNTNWQSKYTLLKEAPRTVFEGKPE